MRRREEKRKRDDWIGLDATTSKKRMVFMGG